ncbi:glycosyltransferase family protein 64 C3 isoform X2 [Impatiens glandulifera]|uniref:glycosyltransferase family protein 64 C3 isoform X1 n=1 Tax=Impatiens glandulifera TaxID=253017 RepID=UPI001FB0C6BB|nr:glycosyltransferase family protein 64 C3 isoform X1 [Impatiens glandulifera]XP_047317099.1 glycosyltransferase family protein 64 C3 isoform X2 [Impatiens glandulifera]
MIPLQKKNQDLLLFTIITNLFLPIVLVFSLRSIPSSDTCNHKLLPDPRTLRPDQTTVLINGYSESRIPLLRSIVAAYSSSSSIASIIVLWGNPSTSSKTLSNLSNNLTSISYGTTLQISLILQSSDSLNSRFLPRPQIQTRSVIICDDDIEIDSESVEFAFQVWTQNQNRLIGFFARSHEIDILGRTWIYTVHPEKYSIILTKFMIMKTDYLYKYSCEGGNEMGEARRLVEKMRNCEDILMNFVAAEELMGGVVLVGAERARDWGDPRNELGKELSEAGLSSRRRDHRRRRGECIREFHRILGKMSLRYGYGKMVNSVGEQGLCDKGGKLVFCDHQF